MVRRFSNRIGASDIALLLFAGVVLSTYRYDRDLSPEFLLFLIQMVLLWFMLKIIYRHFPKFKMVVLACLLIWGVIEAFSGLGQLYDFTPSKHGLFKTTGSFFNPGPYGGFIALIFPLSLHYWLQYRHKKQWLAGLFLFAGVTGLPVFPATMSRTAWIAAVAGCMVVLLTNSRAAARLLSFRRGHKKLFAAGIAVLGIFLVMASYGIYHLKKDSADGRLFMWKITTLAIRDSPVTGTGLGGFPAAYAEAQMNYFKQGNGSRTEKLVAGSPEYAFNEYLQILLEQGIAGFALFVLLSYLVIRNGIRNREYGATGSFVTLSVFALASYPYRLWQFPVVWVLLGSVCTSKTDPENIPRDRHGWRKTVVPIFLLLALCAASITCASRQGVFLEARKEWKKVRPLYSVKAYGSIVDDYGRLYPLLDHEPKFLFEYGMMLNATGEKGKADSILQRGIERSGDPMFYNVKGRNYYEMGEYGKAEVSYMDAAWLLPERVYPYYLLTKLYADSACFQPRKLRRAANAVLEKEPKVHSTAVREMREEVRKILKEKGFTDE